MSFKFVAEDLKSGQRGSMTVKATSEAAARQKLRLGGYSVVRLVRVNNGQESSIKIHGHSPSLPSLPASAVASSKGAGRTAYLARLIARFELLVCYS
jgi:hypothetical protein